MCTPTGDDGADDTRAQQDAAARKAATDALRKSVYWYGDGGVAGRLRVLSNFQVAPLLHYWQAVTGAAPGVVDVSLLLCICAKCVCRCAPLCVIRC